MLAVIWRIAFALLVPTSISAQRTPRAPECGLLQPDQFYNLEKLVRPDELPWMARLYANNSESAEVRFICAGVLISDQYVLTAAQCFRRGVREPTVVVLGYCGPRDSCASVHEIQTSLTHPHYDGEGGSFDYDIGLTLLKEAVTFTDHIRPICLPEADVAQQDFVAQQLPLTGWTALDRAKYKVFVLVMSTFKCRKYYSARLVTTNMICANTCDNGSKFISGSALMGVKVRRGEPHHYYLIGLLAFGQVGCTDFKPDVFNRIDSALVWINAVLNEL